MLFGNIRQLNMLPFTQENLRNWITEAVQITEGKEDGKYHLSNDQIFAIVATTETEPFEKRRSEIHKKYVDVQILLEGKECLGYANTLDLDSQALTELENDVMFFDQVENENFVHLTAGDFAVFYPDQLHRPLCASGQPGKVKKVIIKIPKDLL